MSLQDSGQYYHEVLKRIPPRDLPAFEDEAMQERVWGRRWGVYDDVGPIRTVLVHRPGDEIRIMTADRYDPSIEALIDDEAQWYWRGDRAPDLAVMQREHDALVEALSARGRRGRSRRRLADRSQGHVHARQRRDRAGRRHHLPHGPGGRATGHGPARRGGPREPRDRRARDADPPHHPRQRTLRGRELRAPQRARPRWPGCRSARTRRPRARSRRCSPCSASGCSGCRSPATRCTSTASSSWWTRTSRSSTSSGRRTGSSTRFATSRSAGSRCITPTTRASLNCLAVRPGKVLLAINNGDGTAERLVDHGVEVVPLQYAECQQNGGGIHCSTLPLVRDRS